MARTIERVSEGEDFHVRAQSRQFGASTTTDLLVAAMSADGTTPSLALGDAVLKPAVTINGSTALAGNPLMFTVHAGVAAAGPVTLTGTKVGDKVAGVANLTTPGDLASSFESTITVAGQIQQSTSTDLSAKQCLFLIVHQS